MMMDCDLFRRTLLSDPRSAGADLSEHRRTCSECTAYVEDLARFEERLGRAIRLPVAASGNVVPLRPKRSPSAVRRFAMAASLLLGAVVAGGLWLAAPRSSLAEDAALHMAGEPQAWKRTEVPVPAERLAAVLRDAGVLLLPGAGMVTYANICSFRGRLVPHLVVQTDAGPVTVMVLGHESVPREVRFDEHGYRGVIVPAAGHGSLAVLAQGRPDRAWVDRVAARLFASVQWVG
jgi:hypothetical protein